jgi:hypothetical protein
MDSTTAAVGALGALVGAAIPVVVNAVLSLMAARHKYRHEDRQQLDQEVDRLIARHTADYDRLDKRYREQQEEIELIGQRERSLELRYERALARIGYLEEALDRENIAFRRWDPTPSDTATGPGSPPLAPPGGPHDPAAGT